MIHPKYSLIEHSVTLIERKSRMPQIQDIKGKIVFVYFEPLITQKMGYHRLSRRVNKMGLKIDIYNSPGEAP
jgi:hypothetical protein